MMRSVVRLRLNFDSVLHLSQLNRHEFNLSRVNFRYDLHMIFVQKYFSGIICR